MTTKDTIEISGSGTGFDLLSLAKSCCYGELSLFLASGTEQFAANHEVLARQIARGLMVDDFRIPQALKDSMESFRDLGPVDWSTILPKRPIDTWEPPAIASQPPTWTIVVRIS